MKKYLFITLVLGILVALPWSKNALSGAENSRFRVVHSENLGWGFCQILEDSQTGQQYFFYKEGSSAGLSKL